MTKDKKILFGIAARQAVLNGVELLCTAVGSTLGPKGKNVFIGKRGARPIVTKDGVTVAKSIELDDKFMAVGAELVKEVASQTHASVGDGTTTASVLALSACEEIMKVLTGNEITQAELREQLQNAGAEIINYVNKSSIKISNKDDITRVATVSSNNDKRIGELIATALELSGENGTVVVEDAKGFRDEIDVVDGASFDCGFMSTYFVTNQQKYTADLLEPYVLLTDMNIQNLGEIVKALEFAKSKDRPILIVADDVSGEALQGLVVNKVKGALNCCAVKAPGFGDLRSDMLSDIACMLGGKVFSRESGVALTNMTLNDLGRCKKAIISKKSMTLYFDKSQRVDDRIAELTSLVKNPTLDDEMIRKIRERLARLSKGVVTISVGGSTAIEIQEKRDRVDDALNATRVAIESGIVAGGGIALLNAANTFKARVSKLNSGEKIVMQMCVAPIKKILLNAGLEPDDVIQKFDTKNHASGFDAASGKYCDMFDAGIIDPTKVTMSAFSSAVSIACAFSMLDCVIIMDDVIEQD